MARIRMVAQTLAEAPALAALASSPLAVEVGQLRVPGVVSMPLFHGCVFVLSPPLASLAPLVAAVC